MARISRMKGGFQGQNAESGVDEVVASFLRLTRAQVYECLAYYEDHQDELGPLVAAQTQHLDE